MSEWRKLKEYSHRAEAEIDRIFLEENGIVAIIKADDAGGMYPSTVLYSGVQLLVADTDAYRARQLLDLDAP